MKRFKIAKTLNNLRDKFLFCSILMLSVFYSCTKIDVQKKDPKNSILIEDFFKVNKPVSQAVADIILKLKLENERTNFVNNLPKECGTPVWDKLLIQNSSSFASRGSDSLNDIIIPLSINNTCLSSILIFHDSISGNQVDCFTTNTYLYNETHATSVDTSKAMNDLLLFFYMESNTYGTTEFYHIPTNLFFYSHQLGTDGKKIITIQNDTNVIINNTVPESGMAMNVVLVCPVCGVTTCYGTAFIHHYVNIGEGNGGPGGRNTGGGGSGPGGSGPGGPPGGSGGSGGGPTGGGGPAPCSTGGKAWYSRIIEPSPCNPPPPPPPVINDTILDPCSDAVLLQSSASFKSYLQELKDSTNSNREYGYFMYKDNNGVFGNTPIGLLQGPQNKLKLEDFDNNFIIDCFAHSHFDTNTDSTKGLSVFSPDDLWTMCTQFNANNYNVANPSSFTIALVTKSGTQYLLKIENLTKFRAWAHSFTQGNLKVYYEVFGGFYGIKPSNTNTQNEKAFLKYLKLNNGSGLKMFRGNSTFTNWQPIGLDPNNNVINSTCI